jgi:hypothetical protein
MKIKEPIEKLEADPEFKGWFKSNRKSYLVHIFKLVDDSNKNIWQIGYYNKDSTITSFVLEESKIKIIPEEEIFQEKRKKVKKLDLGKVKLDIDEALKIAEDFQKKEYKGSDPQKIMLILQNIDGKILYNITYITANFNALNMKIDVSDGSITFHDLSPFVRFSGKAS